MTSLPTRDGSFTCSWLLQNVTSGESFQIISALVARTLWAFLNLSRGSLLEFGHCQILVLTSSDFWLPQNATSQERSSDHCHVFSTDSGGCTGSLGKVSSRIPQMSVFSTFRGRHVMHHHKSPDASSSACCHAVSSSPDGFRNMVSQGGHHLLPCFSVLLQESSLGLALGLARSPAV